MKTLSVIGTGKLGLTFGLLCEHVGYAVMATDKNEKYVKSLQDKTFKSVEPYVDDYLHNSHFFNVSTQTKDALEFSDIIFCIVPTPSLEDGQYNHEYIEEVIADIISYAKEGNDLSGKTFVISCTVMPQYCKGVAERLSECGVSVVYNPFLIAQGSIVKDLMTADVVLIGSDKPVSQDLIWVYKSIMTSPPNIKLLGHTQAEIVKISINCYLVTKIAYANMIGNLCIESGVFGQSVDSVLNAIGSDTRIGNKFFGYGLPASGVCLPRDSRALKYYLNQIHFDGSFIDGVMESNTNHLEYLAQSMIDNHPDKNIPIEFNQLSYKKGVPLITESKHLELCIMILKEGIKVHVIESENVIEQVKSILAEYGDMVSYEVESN